MTYYHDIITEKSWKSLQEMKRRYNFILIGGWAVYLYTKGLKSRDIDIICDYETLQKLKTDYELIKNERLKKYEVHQGEFDIDIYVPFFSELGLPVENLQKMTTVKEGFSLITPEALLILKQKAHHDRAQSLKGEKDKIDIIALLYNGVDMKKYKTLIKKYELKECLSELKMLLQTTYSVPELNLKDHTFAKWKRKIVSGLA